MNNLFHIKNYETKSHVLALIETFTILQMGIIYYSAFTLSINNKIFLLDSSITTILVVLGYIIGALAIYIFPKKTITIGKILVGTIFCLSISLFIPLSITALTIVYYLIILFCVMLISIEASLMINLYSQKTALKAALIAAIISAPIIALIQNGIILIKFEYSIILMIIIEILMFIGLSKLDKNAKFVFIGKKDKKMLPPNKLLYGTILSFTAICFGMLFSSNISETIKLGIPTLYIAGGIGSVITYYLIFKKKLNPFRICTILFVFQSFGFLLWLMPIPFVKYISIILLGSTVIMSSLSWFFVGTLFERYSSKIVAPLSLIIALLTVIINAILIESFKTNTEILFCIYIIIMIGILIVYLTLESYFYVEWEKNTSYTDFKGNKKYKIDKIFEELSKREKEIAELMINGYSYKEISKKLFISEYTTKEHIKKIFSKLNIHSKWELISMTIN